MYHSLQLEDSMANRFRKLEWCLTYLEVSSLRCSNYCVVEIGLYGRICLVYDQYQHTVRFVIQGRYFARDRISRLAKATEFSQYKFLRNESFLHVFSASLCGITEAMHMISESTCWRSTNLTHFKTEMKKNQSLQPRNQ